MSVFNCWLWTELLHLFSNVAFNLQMAINWNWNWVIAHNSWDKSPKNEPSDSNPSPELEDFPVCRLLHMTLCHKPRPLHCLSFTVCITHMKPVRCLHWCCKNSSSSARWWSSPHLQLLSRRTLCRSPRCVTSSYDENKTGADPGAKGRRCVTACRNTNTFTVRAADIYQTSTKLDPGGDRRQDCQGHTFTLTCSFWIK